MKLRRLRFMPSLFVLALLALVARAQTPAALRQAGLAPAKITTVPRPAASNSATTHRSGPPRVELVQCTWGGEAVVTPSAQFFLPPDAKTELYQPIHTHWPIVSSNFAVAPQFVQGATLTAGLYFYDPQASDPVAGSYALDIRYPTPSAADEGVDILWSNVLVTRVLGGGSETSAAVTVTAVKLTIEGGSTPIMVGVDFGKPTVTAGYASNSNGQIQFPGGAPGFGASVCAAPIEDDLLGILQQVVRVNSTITLTATSVPVSSTADFLQSFVSPVSATAEWVELALSAPPSFTAEQPIFVDIYDYGNGVVPPMIPVVLTATASVISADPLSPALAAGVWAHSSKFPVETTLLAGHRYWIAIRSAGGWTLGMDAQGGDPNGSFYYRTGPTGTYQSDLRDLSYRIVAKEKPKPVAVPVAISGTAIFSSFNNATNTASYPVSTRGRLVQPLLAVPTVSGVLMAGRRSVSASAFPNGPLTLRFMDAACDAPLDNTYPLAVLHKRDLATGTSVGEGDWSWSNRPNSVTITAGDPGGDPNACSSQLALVVDAQGQDSPGDVFYYRRYASGTAQPYPSAYVDTQIGRLPLPVANTLESPIVAMTVFASGDPHSDGRRAFAQNLPVENTFTSPPGALVAQSIVVTGTVVIEGVALAIPGRSSPFAHLPISIVETPDDSPPTFASPVITTLTVTYDDDLEANEGLWVGSEVITASATLMAGHHYWIVLHPDGIVPLAMSGGGGTTGGYPFGRLVIQHDELTGWTETGGDLSFRLIGYPAGSTNVPGPTPRPQIAWSLRASPNPFTRSVALAWEGSAGGVSIDIIDVRGRIVRSVRPQLAGLAGSWVWRGETSSGHLVGPGVYFARATRGGQTAVRRVTFVP